MSTIQLVAAAGGGGGAVTTGGTKFTSGSYTYHAFTFPNSEAFDVGTDIGDGLRNIDILLVGGGGAGGSYYGAGGGAGGVVRYTNFPVAAGTSYTISIGNGGQSEGTTGSSSTFAGLPGGTITAAGGGGGGPSGTKNGGSGGGASSVPSAQNGGSATQPGLNPAYTPSPNFNQWGNAGGNYIPGATGYAPTGGGGAGAAGESTPSNISGGGDGGNGIQIPEFPGPIIPVLSSAVPRMGPTSDYYGGGGGAGGYNTTGGTGGYGGGGQGTNSPAADPQPSTTTGVNGLGGGGGGQHQQGGSFPAPVDSRGGSGICLIRYLTP
jgi:hypothetical protein